MRNSGEEKGMFKSVQGIALTRNFKLEWLTIIRDYKISLLIV